MPYLGLVQNITWTHRCIGGMINSDQENQSISTVFTPDMSGTNIIRLTMTMTTHHQKLCNGINSISFTLTSLTRQRLLHTQLRKMEAMVRHASLGSTPGLHTRTLHLKLLTRNGSILIRKDSSAHLNVGYYMYTSTSNATAIVGDLWTGRFANFFCLSLFLCFNRKLFRRQTLRNTRSIFFRHTNLQPTDYIQYKIKEKKNSSPNL